MDRVPIFARLQIEEKLALTEKAASLHRSVNDVLGEVIKAWRLSRPFNLSKKEKGNSAVDINKKKVRELREKRRQRRKK